MTCSITTCFGVSTSALIYMPSIQTDWNSMLIPPTVTTRSITGCWLVRELKLGLFIDPIREGAISQFVTSYFGIYAMSAFGLYTFDDASVHSGIGGKREALGDENHLERDMELGDVSLRPCG